MSNIKGTVPLVGYSDRLSARPGETIEFKVSSQLDAPYTARLTRSISADPNPQGLGIVEHAMDDKFAQQTLASRSQAFFPGSYALSNKPLHLEEGLNFGITITLKPTRAKTSPQTILCWGDFCLYLDSDNAVSITLGQQTLNTDITLALRSWHQLNLSFDRSNNCMTLVHSTIHGTEGGGLENDNSAEFILNDDNAFELNAPVCIAARNKDDVISEHFNGKIESPSLHSSANDADWQLLAGWNFSKDMASTSIPDEGSDKNHLQLINFPARAMTGSAWDGSEMCWRHKSEHYEAIHFHEDDIVDFEWDTDFSFAIPPDLASGVYVMRIQSGEHEDAMPFYVCPPIGTTGAKLCVLIPTFTYAVYGNHARPDYADSWQQKNTDWGAYPNNPAQYPQYGLSTYNFHSDGSGICHASHKRPLFNLRPGYVTFGNTTCSGLRHFQADSHLISWLHEKNIDYDIITDQQLHDEGVSAIENYAAVTTTTHPEYHTAQSLNALQDYRNSGGRLAYLGGNGFYWRIATHTESDAVLEIRRGEDGIRAWAAESGEYYHAFDGAYGGLWRRSGRPPQQLVGVGFSAQGQFNGSYYRRVCHDEKFDWAFEGIDDDKIGNFGFSGNGAAGFELDRMDILLGSPENSTILASSEAHGDDFILVPEEMLTHLTNVPGEPEEKLLRADMIYFEVPGGGAVFTTGSITFCGSLPYNGFRNNVSTLLENVFRHMGAA